MKIISVLNHKGGVGKTTFTGSIAQALSLIGFRVLAIDNDSQHNLSSLLGLGVKEPNIFDIYKVPQDEAPEWFLRSVLKTELNNLHMITSCRDLCESVVKDKLQLKNCFAKCRLDRYYDFIIIDNAPGLDLLQAASIHASDEIFVPTELRQFAIDGLVEMESTIQERYPDGATISRIIPNFYKNTKRHNSFIAALNKLFPQKVTQTFVPVDPVFDEVVTEGKILFLHRLYSKGAALYLKLTHELFSLDEDKVWEQVSGKRNAFISEQARIRFFKQKNGEQ